MDDRKMDSHAEKLIDVAVEAAVRRGYAIVELPEAHYMQLLDEREMSPVLPAARRYRFTKLTPKKRALVAAATQRRYFSDLKNPDILSREQIRKLNLERGQWSEVQEKRMADLLDETNALSQKVYLDGLDVEQRWQSDRLKAILEFQSSLEAKGPDGTPLLDSVTSAGMLLRFTRWLGWRKERQVEYTTLYAADQGLAEYAPDADLTWLGEHAPSLAAVDALNAVVEVNDRLADMDVLIERRRELYGLQIQEAKMYQDCVEQRRDYAEEMARLYYLTEALGDRDIPTGPMTATVDDLYNLPDDLVQWFFVELYIFINSVPNEAREYLETMGFIQAPRPDGSSASSDALPAEPSSKTATPPSEETLSGSSEPTPLPAVRVAPTISTISS